MTGKERKEDERIIVPGESGKKETPLGIPCSFNLT